MIIGEILILGETVFPSNLYSCGGKITVDGVAAERRIMVFNRKTGEFFGSTRSDPDGSWKLPNRPAYDPRLLLVVALDDEPGELNAEVADFVSLERVTGE